MSTEITLTLLSEQLSAHVEKYTQLEAKVALISENINEENLIQQRKSIEETSANLSNIRIKASDSISQIESISKSVEELNKVIIDFYENAQANNDSINHNRENVENNLEAIKSVLNELNEIFKSKEETDTQLKELESIFEKSSDYDSKISSIFKSVSERKKEIDETYYEIFGYVDKDNEEIDIQVAGKKSELDKAYDSLKIKHGEIEKELATLKELSIKEYNSFQKQKEVDFESIINSWESQYSSSQNKIDSLLPNALTAGLSHAYSEKKRVERQERSNHKKSFNIAIIGLIVVSLIPFAISIISIFQKATITEVLIQVPRLVLAILPLYIPVLWVAYSSNRKMNLSKRLIEEYSHKEVLSKTFEGLSKQISSVEDKAISSDLRIKLLYNILEVNSENPGKLISDYNKSDHPMMDALDKSIKLTNAVTKLAKIPGFAKLASTLEKKSQRILEEESKKAEAGIKTVD